MERLTKANQTKRSRKHGFLERMKTHSGQLVVKRRKARGRKRLTV
ncbi:50S ribosomal protein L34 [Patescibacteria group bacterium]|nr:50S ribosomal protein L34 [Patescibacteria group bacterium]